MTREEAAEKINWLYYEADYGNNLPDDMETAVDMAIAALKQPEIIRCKDCKSNRNEDGTTGCDFHNFWYAADDGYCNFGTRRGEE